MERKKKWLTRKKRMRFFRVLFVKRKVITEKKKLEKKKQVSSLFLLCVCVCGDVLLPLLAVRHSANT